MSTGVRGVIIGAGGMPLFEMSEENSKLDSSEMCVEIRVNTLEWKCGLVMGLVSISY